MGQYWTLFNVDRGEIGNGVSGKWHEFFTNEHTFLLDALTIPYPSKGIDKWLQSPTAGDLPQPEDKGLLRFPNELLLEIIAYCPDLPSKICLALTCKRLTILGREHIEKVKVQVAALWAGGRIICAGDYTRSDDLPPSIQDVAVQAMDKGHNENDEDDEDDDDDESGAYGGLCGICRESVSQYRGELWTLRQNRYLNGDDYHRFMALNDKHYPARDDWVLCNLTMGVYVRSMALSEGAKKSWGVDNPPGLAHAVLYKIGWSSEPSTDFDLGTYTGDLARGEWAGHRFCITTLERLPAPPEGKQWDDISDEVVKDLECIWSAQ